MSLRNSRPDLSQIGPSPHATCMVTTTRARGRPSTEAYHRLRELIVHGRLAPGTRVIELEVAERLGVSRTPVRAALQRLRQEGYIVASERQTRPTVAPLTDEDAREVFAIVGGIEGIAARGAAALPSEPRATSTRDLQEANDACLRESRAERPDPNALFAIDTRFHRLYVEAGAGTRVIALHDAIKPQAERYIRLYTSALTDEIATSVAEHQIIIDAIGRGDPGGAQFAVENNWRNAARRLSRAIRSAGERGSW